MSIENRALGAGNPFFRGTAQHFAWGLRVALAKANSLYFQGLEGLTDAEYDELIAKLKEIEFRFPQVYHPKSPTQVVWGDCLYWPPEGSYRRDALGMDS